MLKRDKVAFVGRFTDVLANNNSFVLLRSSGIGVGAVTKLRFNLRAANAGLIVVKNRLVRIALRDVRPDWVDALSNYLSHPLSVAYSDDVVALSKVVCNFTKDATSGGKVQVVCGLFGGRVVDSGSVERMATMPSTDEMRSSIVALLQSGPRSIVSGLEYHKSSLVHALGVYLEQLKS